ncbi:hypothetical protein C8Q77DRAFT_1148167 [Trametes polyzona]|nr:hypothetical protein C8Q77DRAFT_1148167 [Trametes polyzona]
MYATTTNNLLRSFISSPVRCACNVSTRSTRSLSSSSCRAVYSTRRTFASTPTARAVHAQHPPGQHAELVSYPSPSALQQEEEDADAPDVEFVPPEEATLALTDRAAEQLQRVAQGQGNPEAALRVAVESGGCHGYQYKLDLAKSKQPDDYHFSHPRIKPSNVYVDAVSMSLLKGSTIDFATELIGSSFRVLDNPQAKGNGCGCGVSWELKL